MQAEEKVHLAVAHRAKGQSDKAHAPQKGGGPPVAKVVEGPVEARPTKAARASWAANENTAAKPPPPGRAWPPAQAAGRPPGRSGGQGQQHQVELLQGVVPGEEQRGPKEHQGPAATAQEGPASRAATHPAPKESR